MANQDKPFYLIPSYRNSFLATLVSVFANLFLIFMGFFCLAPGIFGVFSCIVEGKFDEIPIALGFALIGAAMIFAGVKLRGVAEKIAINKYKKDNGLI